MFDWLYTETYLWAWLGQTFTFTRRCLESAITLTCSNCFAINPSLQTDQMKISRRESEQKTDLIIWGQLRSQLRFSAWLPISWPSSHNPTFGELVSKLRAWLAGSNFYFHPHSAMSWISHNPLTYCSHWESNEVDICNELSKNRSDNLGVRLLGLHSYSPSSPHRKQPTQCKWLL